MALTLAGTQAIAQVPIGGNLVVRPGMTNPCGEGGLFFEGEMMEVDGSGFSPGATVEIYFGDDPSNLSLVHTDTADASGGLDTTVMIPIGLSTPYLGVMEARGSSAGGTTLYLTTVFPVATSPGPDSDTDTIPDTCDNCPSDSNQDQADLDGDGIGDVCDACPSDSMNDKDGDGLCADVDECPFDANNDIDGDGRCADEDNCPSTANPSQLDQDRNGVGDACQTTPTCSDGLDNDRDGFTDHPSDSGCSDADDTTETDPSLPCDDGIDNDADAKFDFRPGIGGDPGCGADTTLAENPECDDGIDNDGDGHVDWDGNFTGTPDPECDGIGSGATEMPEPSVLHGLLAGVVILYSASRRRNRQWSARES